jgi:deoxyribodipyrimidine photo-lyase
MSAEISICWFRRDLRLADHPPLEAALARGGPVVPVFIWAPEEESPWAPARASQWWLRQSLVALDAELRRRGSRLVIRKGPSLAALRALSKETGATAVFWSHAWEPAARARDRAVENGLRDQGIVAEPRDHGLLFDPAALRNQSGHPFRVFTPFWRACLRQPPPGAPIPPPPRLPAPRRWPTSLDPRALGRSAADGTAALGGSWQPGERGAEAAHAPFVAEAQAA